MQTAVYNTVYLTFINKRAKASTIMIIPHTQKAHVHDVGPHPLGDVRVLIMTLINVNLNILWW